MLKFCDFTKEGQMSRSPGHKFQYAWKGLATSNTHVNMKALSQRVQKLQPMLKFCDKGQGQGHEVINFSMHGKVSPQATHMSNMKALSQRVQKLWPMLKFLC